MLFCVLSAVCNYTHCERQFLALQQLRLPTVLASWGPGFPKARKDPWLKAHNIHPTPLGQVRQAAFTGGLLKCRRSCFLKPQRARNLWERNKQTSTVTTEIWHTILLFYITVSPSIGQELKSAKSFPSSGSGLLARSRSKASFSQMVI